MDWDYFRDEKTGNFGLRRLPPIKKPVRVTDKTDLSTEREFFRGLDMTQGIKEYEHAFRDALSYEPEIEDLEGSMNRAAEAELGPLAPFRGQFEIALDLLDRLAEEEWIDQAVQIDEKLARKAEQGGLVERFCPDSVDSWIEYWLSHTVAELKAITSGLGLKTTGKKAELAGRLAEHISENPADAPRATLVRASPALAEAVQTALTGILEQLDIQLREYPPGYQQAVWSEIRLDWESDHWKIGQAIPDHENSKEVSPPARVPAQRAPQTAIAGGSATPATNRHRGWIAIAIAAVVLWLLFR